MNSSEKAWRQYMSDGDRFLKTAMEGNRKRKAIFTPEILYNIVSMAIEKHFMSFLLYHNRLPDNHTLTDLADAVRGLESLDDSLSERLVRMDRFQQICALSEYLREPPQENDVLEFLEIGRQVRDFVACRLPGPSAN